MRKVFQFMMISADGYFEGPGHKLDWQNVDDPEFTQFADEQLDTADTLVFGRITYKLMEDFWPTEQAMQLEPSTAERMNRMPKYVFAHTAMDTNWQNVQAVIGDDPIPKIKELKEQDGKDIAVLASSNLCLTLLMAGVIDEVRLMVNPILLGNGTSLFSGLPAHIKLELKDTRVFQSGNVLLTYVPGQPDAVPAPTFENE